MWRKSTLQHFDLGAVISSLLKTLPLPLPSIQPTCSCCPSLSPSLLIEPWDVEYVSALLFCFILDIMLCCLWKKKKKIVDNKKKKYNQRGLHCHYQGEREGEFSGVMILLRRGRSAAKCSSATHYSYHCLSAWKIATFYFVSPYLLV